MKIKLTTLTAGILAALAGTANAFTPPNPPTPDPIYNGGPASPLLNTTNLSVAERSAFALLEGVMQVAEAKIYASSCAAGTWNLEVYADGSLNNAAATTIFNRATVTTAGGTNAPQFSLGASVKDAVVNRGQAVVVALQGAGVLGGTPIINYEARHIFNNLNNMMVTPNANITLTGGNGTPDTFQGSVIKDFFRGSTDSTKSDYYNIYDWGLQSVSKAGYPVNKWWQRSKTHRDNGVNGRTVWVKDRLVGAGSCRITIETNGYNDQQPLFWQGNPQVGPGTLSIAPLAPSAAVNLTDPSTGNVGNAWTQYPF